MAKILTGASIGAVIGGAVAFNNGLNKNYDAQVAADASAPAPSEGAYGNAFRLVERYEENLPEKLVNGVELAPNEKAELKQAYEVLRKQEVHERVLRNERSEGNVWERLGLGATAFLTGAANLARKVKGYNRLEPKG